MSLVHIGIGAVIGFFIGIGASLLFLRWKMKRQLGLMQNQMQDMMDMTQGMGDGLEDLEVEDIEEDEKEGEV